MAANTSPIFSGSPNLGMGQLTTANTNRDGVTGAYVLLFTAGANGAFIENCYIMPVGTTTAGIVRLFLDDGTNRRLFHEEEIAANTPSATVAADTYTVTKFQGLGLKAGWKVYGSTEKTETFNVFLPGGDY